MSVAIVAPQAVPVTWGGAERAVDGLRAAIERHTPHRAEVMKLPVDESNLVGIVAGYRDFSRLDLSAHDRVVSVKYPAWIVSHPRHTLLMFHPLRGLYDTYHLFGLPLHPSPQTREVADLRTFMGSWGERSALPEFFERFDAAQRAIGRHHTDLAFPGPFAREVVHWLDRVALGPGQVERYAALSRTVARRPDYFPAGVHPKVVPLPGDLEPAPPRTEPGHSFFTASRLDGAKRLELVIDAMAHVPGDVALRIAGTGPLADELRARAAHDPRISFCGFVPDESLAVMYREAIAVPFVPDDEDLGLVALEAFSQATPVVTCTDSGGPTEFVADGVTGLVVPPTPAAVGRALARLAADRTWAADLGREAQRRGARVTWARAVADLLGDPPAAIAPARAPEAGGTDTASRGPRTRRRPRVVVLATFTVDAPRHGGELRARNLYGALAHEADVHVVSLVGRGWAPSSGPVAPGLTQTVVPRSRAHADLDDEVSLEARIPVTDILAGPHSAHTPAYRAALEAATAEADLVLLAEPYLLPALLESGCPLPFVYDAYNVEADLKAAALPPTPVRAELLRRVEAIERAAVTEAAAVTACSDIDAAALAARYGRNRASFTVIPNGTTVLRAVPLPAERRAASERWRRQYRRSAGTARTPEALAVFFGSWHPPNLDAARLIAEVALERPEVLFLSCGSHGQAFDDQLLPPNVVFAGNVAERTKAKLLATADVALNPMRIGSGTNLKLIEYLTAAVPVLSTPFGARGTEVVDGEHLLLADPERFAAGLAGLLADPDGAARRAVAGCELVRRRYDWEVLGRDLARVVADLAPAPVRQ